MKRIFSSWFKKYRIHILVWIIFILYESITIGWLLGVFGNPITYAAHYIIIISLFYFHANWSMPWALTNNKRILWKVPAILVLEIVVFILISFFTDKLLIITHILFNKGPLILNLQYSLKTFFRDLYFIGFSTGYYFLLTYNKEKRKTNELEKQRLKDIIYQQKSEQDLTKAQNAYLKAQINPHFLFNTLDFVYHNILTLSPNAADTIITLSEMMRYAIDSDKMGDFIPLGDEIDQVENLVYLNQIRKNHELGFILEYEENVRQIYLTPLVLLTIVENIFKHGNLTEDGHNALVHVYLKNETFFIETDNLINLRTKGAGNNKGMSNTEQRLKYAYGDNILFNYYSDESSHFKVQLSIPLKQLKYPGEPLIFLPDTDI
ncbi:MAG: Histidine kinase [Mucilaginibacter sp.]|nr:Histidine kinase [Mucilaginibacter sp.]